MLAIMRGCIAYLGERKQLWAPVRTFDCYVVGAVFALALRWL